jgi:AAA15 family ATPase/GTPase
MSKERLVVSNKTRFQFRNLGPISEAELELGDLTIIAGRNNTGKTYLTYVLYEFLKRVSIHVLYSKAYSRFFESHLMETTGLSKKGFHGIANYLR